MDNKEILQNKIKELKQKRTRNPDNKTVIKSSLEVKKNAETLQSLIKGLKMCQKDNQYAGEYFNKLFNKSQPNMDDLEKFISIDDYIKKLIYSK